MTSSSMNVLCKHNISPIEQTVKKNGANRGRRFLRCPNWKIDDCGFFQWVKGGELTCSRSSYNLYEKLILY
ncbi:hypothetical protein RND81_07G197400 [Saponaria officinalis]|uniref:GRF-type domain-containing protein n=1 Tax=Saponaria officinalis TaxID=3572 RepID=A0AAW1JTN3_SAPOF